MGSRRRNLSEHFRKSNFNNYIQRNLYLVRLFNHKQCNNNGQSISHSQCEFPNNLYGPIGYAHCIVISWWRNLFMVARRRKHAKHYSFPRVNNNLYSNLYFIWLFIYRKWNRHSQSSTNGERKFLHHLYGTKCYTNCYSINRRR